MLIRKDNKLWRIVYAGMWLCCSLVLGFCALQLTQQTEGLWLTKTDDELRKTFRNHKTQFEEMRTMVTTEPILYRVSQVCGCFNTDGKDRFIIWDGSSTAEMRTVGIGPDRLAQYMELMKATGINYIDNNKSNKLVNFQVGSGWLPYQGQKFICYRPGGTPPGYHIVQDTANSASEPDQDKIRVCSQLEKDWYILRDSNHDEGD